MDIDILLEASKNTSTPKLPRCIFRVPEVLRRHNVLAYAPDIISIGPYHPRDNVQFQAMENLKYEYLRDLLLHMDRSHDRDMELEASINKLVNYILDHKKLQAMSEFEKKARDFYAHPFDPPMKMEFLHMMILDGCFLVQIFRKFVYKELHNSSTPHQQPIHHPHQNYHPTNNHYTIIKMDKAKAAITDFMGRSGHHDTTVHEAVAPAVQHEVIKPHVHEEINTAIDKEVHQDHYHRTVQPVHDREVLPEQHTAKLGAVQHREFDHRDADATKRALIDDQARFADERRIEDTTHSQSVAPTVGGEHVHHHIHETIQPVVQKETIQPNVVHTTVPIHEVHHNKATHHETTALPAMTMEQFKAKGGALTGREERYDEFEGVPKNIGGAGGIGAAAGLAHKTTSHGHEHARHGDYDATPNHHSDAGLREGGLTHNSTTTGTHNPLDRNNDGKVSAKDLTGSHSNTSHTDRGVAGQGNLTGSSTQGGVVGSGVGDRNHDGKIDSQDLRDPARSGNHGATGQHKPSLMDKLNPKVDADGDGKAGFMK